MIPFNLTVAACDMKPEGFGSLSFLSCKMSAVTMPNDASPKALAFANCQNLKTLPESSLVDGKKVDIAYVGLKQLYITDCESFTKLPDAIIESKELTNLSLRGLSKDFKIDKRIFKSATLKELVIDAAIVKQLGGIDAINTIKHDGLTVKIEEAES